MNLVRTQLVLAAAIAAAGCAVTAPVAPHSPIAPPNAAPPAGAPPAATAPTVSVSYTLDDSPYNEAQRAYHVAQAQSRRVIVKGPDAAIDAAIDTGLVVMVRRLPVMDAAVLDVVGGDIDSALARLRALPHVTHAEREGLALVGLAPRWAVRVPASGGQAPEPATPAAVGGGSSPNDPRFSSQWAFGPIAAVSAWGAALTAASTPVTIAILDTGIDQDHEDIDPTHTQDDQRGRLWRDQDFTGSGTVDDRYGHGTHVAGIAAAATNNGVGIAGIVSNARLINAKVIGDNGVGYDSAIAAGIRWAADQGAQIINMSFGQTTDSTLVREAVAYAAGKGVLMVAAAGNEGKSVLRYPAAYPAVIAVGATTQPVIGRPERRADFSNFGLSWVDIAAPGEGILSTLPNHDNTIKVKQYGTMNGTSMATPMVAGGAAMLWTANGGDAARVRARLEGKSDTTVGGSGTDWAHGRLNLDRALREP
ncbi:Thermophilic serine proteinase precursor [compost metagenome]